MELNIDILNAFDKDWALVTAGSAERFNTMTISWGSLGTLWSRPVASVYVRSSRYTHEFLDREEYFTVSFYKPVFRKKLAVLGSRSGRDMDKMHDSGLTPVFLKNGVTFEEARLTVVCRKLFKTTLEPDRIPENIVSEYYDGEASHDMYIGEVVDIIRGREDIPCGI